MVMNYVHPHLECDCGEQGEWRGPRDGHRVFACAKCYVAFLVGRNSMQRDREVTKPVESQSSKVNIN